MSGTVLLEDLLNPQDIWHNLDLDQTLSRRLFPLAILRSKLPRRYPSCIDIVNSIMSFELASGSHILRRSPTASGWRTPLVYHVTFIFQSVWSPRWQKDQSQNINCLSQSLSRPQQEQLGLRPEISRSKGVLFLGASGETSIASTRTTWIPTRTLRLTNSEYR